MSTSQVVCLFFAWTGTEASIALEQGATHFEIYRKYRTPFLVKKIFLDIFFGAHEETKLTLDQLHDIEEKLQGIEPRKKTIRTTLNLGDGEAT